MITLGMRLQDDFPSYYPMFAMRVFHYGRASYRNHNTMLNNFSGMDGIKTGYTSKSGFNLVSSVRRGGKHVIGAVFGGSSAASRNGEMRMLLTRALTRASAVKTRKPKPALIAKLKSAPKIAERPVKPKPPVQVAAAEPRLALKPQPAPQPAPLAAPVASPVASQVAAAAEAPAPAPASVAPLEAEAPAEAVTVEAPQSAMVGPDLPPAPVEVAKVKKVMVMDRKVSPDETTDMGEDGEPTIESLVARANQETVIAKSAAPHPVETAQFAPAPDQAPVIDKSEMTMLGGRDAAPVPPAPVAQLAAMPLPAPQAAVRKAAAPATKPVAKPAVIKTSAPAPLQRGLPPSTLQAQAASLSPSSAPLQTAALPDSSGRHEIQIGAYDTVEEAQRNLDAVEAKAARALAGHPSVTHPVMKSGRKIYRARFRGFDAQSAATACSRLRAQAIDCFVMTTE
jgi:D-alanyl-D-alanine carboxypeptidase